MVAAERAQLIDLRLPTGGDCVAKTPEHDLRGLLVELHVAPRRQKRELELHGSLDLPARASEQGPEAPVEAELPAVDPDEVEHGAERLARRLSQPAAELLKKERGALGRAEHQHGVDAPTPPEEAITGAALSMPA